MTLRGPDYAIRADADGSGRRSWLGGRARAAGVAAARPAGAGSAATSPTSTTASPRSASSGSAGTLWSTRCPPWPCVALPWRLAQVLGVDGGVRRAADGRRRPSPTSRSRCCSPAARRGLLPVLVWLAGRAAARQPPPTPASTCCRGCSAAPPCCCAARHPRTRAPAVVAVATAVKLWPAAACIPPLLAVAAPRRAATAVRGRDRARARRRQRWCWPAGAGCCPR